MVESFQHMKKTISFSEANKNSDSHKKVVTKKLLLIVFCLFSYSNPVNSQNLDIRLLRSINKDRNQELDPFFKTITHTASPVTIGVPVAMFGISLLNHDKDLQTNSIYTGVSVLTASIVTTSLKYIVDRNRPYISYPELDVQTTGTSSSFPSGHTTVAFATATALSISYPKWYVIAPLYLWAGGVGYSRMHLGVHYPSDVLIGAVIGSGSAYVCYKIKQHIEKKRELRSGNKSYEIIP